MLLPRFPSSFLRAAPVEGKEGHKGRGRSLCPLGTALPRHRAARGTPPRPCPRRAPQAKAPGSHPRTQGDVQALPSPSSRDRAWPPPLQAHPGARCPLTPAAHGAVPVYPRTLHLAAPGSPLTAARSAQPPARQPGSPRRRGSPGPALPARPGHGNAESQRRRSPPLESTTRWRRPGGRGPALAVIATAPSKARPVALRASPHPSPAQRGPSLDTDKSNLVSFKRGAAPPFPECGRQRTLGTRDARQSPAPPRAAPSHWLPAGKGGGSQPMGAARACWARPAGLQLRAPNGAPRSEAAPGWSALPVPRYKLTPGRPTVLHSELPAPSPWSRSERGLADGTRSRTTPVPQRVKFPDGHGSRGLRAKGTLRQSHTGDPSHCEISRLAPVPVPSP